MAQYDDLGGVTDQITCGQNSYRLLIKAVLVLQASHLQKGGICIFKLWPAGCTEFLSCASQRG